MRIKQFLILSVTGAIFTALIYAKPFPQIVYVYFFITVFYTAVIVFANQVYHLPWLRASIFALTTPLLIDASVLITNRDLVPLRFPFASLFLFLASLISYVIIHRKKIMMILTLAGSLLFFYLSHFYFIPAIILYLEKEEKIKLNPVFFTKKFLNAKGDTVILKNLMQPTSFIDLYFVGCAPCRLKEKLFKEIAKDHPRERYTVLLICNGQISSFAQFQAALKNDTASEKIIHLFDFNNQISRFLPLLRGYPYEIVVRNGLPIKYVSGMNEESYMLNYQERVRIIQDK